MPKSNIRYKQKDRRGSSCSGIVAVQSGMTRRNLLLSTPPRKVSFEDSRNDSNLSICSNDTVRTKNKTKRPASQTVESEQGTVRPMRRKRSLLVRPITSLSLVDLAKSVEHDAVSQLKCGQSDADQTEGRYAKRACSINLSPCSVVHTPNHLEVERQEFSPFQSLSEGESKSTKTSPWGHFVDMSPEEDDCINLHASAYPNYGSTLVSNQRRASRCSRKVSFNHSQRRPSPYGEYKSYTIREAHPTLSFVGLRTDSKSKCSFRLTPRNRERNHESADELIGFFSELQVQQAQQKKS